MASAIPSFSRAARTRFRASCWTSTKSAVDAEGHDDAEIHDDAEDPSIEQRRAEHAALFTDADSAAPESADSTVESAYSAADDLLDTWNENTPEDQQFIRDLVLEEFFAEASGTDIFDRIPAARLKEVVGAFLDRLGVDGLCANMSKDFREKLLERMPATRKSDKPQTLKLAANHVREMRDAVSGT